MTSEKYAAHLIIRNGQEFSEQGVKDIATWLRQQATFLLKHHKECAKKYSAKYYYP